MQGVGLDDDRRGQGEIGAGCRDHGRGIQGHGYRHTRPRQSRPSFGQAENFCRGQGPAITGQVRDPAMAYAACGAASCSEPSRRGRNLDLDRRRSRSCSWHRYRRGIIMPKIADIEDTPNPNAVKLVLKDRLTWGTARSFDSAESAADDPLASPLFAIAHLTNAYYMDKWITVTQDGEADWP